MNWLKRIFKRRELEADWIGLHIIPHKSWGEPREIQVIDSDSGAVLGTLCGDGISVVFEQSKK